MRQKVFFLQEIIPNYRVPVFQRLARLEGIALTVFYSRPSRQQRRDNLKNASEMPGFDSIRLPLLEIGEHAYQFAFLKHLLLDRPDIVVSGQLGRLDTLAFLLFCKLLGIRLYWFAGGVPYRDNRKIEEVTRRGRLNKLFGTRNPRRWLVNRADGMIVYSGHAKEYFASLGFPAGRIWVAPNSPDTDALIKYEREVEQDPGILAELRARYSPHGEKILLMLGRLNKERKTDVLLKAFMLVWQRHRKVQLIIIGDGGERDTLEKQVEAEGLSNVHFLGAMYDDRQLAPYFMLCHVFVTPGVASLALKMAMAFGRPVVTVDHGLEVHAVESGKNGFVVAVDDTEALAKNILTLLEDEALWNEMHLGAKWTMKEKINITHMIEGFRKAFNAAA
jgi:glycosyltransferase involved in cell wall biosynthesis